MYARILYVGPNLLQEAGLPLRLQAACRALGHAMQICPDPSETSQGSRSLDAMVEAFQPTVILWDTKIEPEPFSVELKSAGCLVVGIGDDGVEDVESNVFDARLFFSCKHAGPCDHAPVPAYNLCTAADRRYIEATISDPTVKRAGIVIASACNPEQHESIRRAAAQAGIERVESLDQLSLQPGINLAYQLRTFSYAIFPVSKSPLSAASILLRRAEGLTVLAEEKSPVTENVPNHQPDVIPYSTKGLADLLVHLEKQADRDASPVIALDDQLTCALEFLQSVASKRGLCDVMSFENPCTLVLAYGWFGAHNYGDDLLLRLVADRVANRYPNSQVFVIGADQHAIRCEYGFEAATPHEKTNIQRHLPWASALIYCGGLLFDQPMAPTAGSFEFALDPWIEPSGQASIALMAATHHARPVMLGVGGGPIELPATKRSIDLLGRAGTLFITRDEHTSSFLEAAGAPDKNVVTKADLVLGSMPYIERHAAREKCPEEPGSAYLCVSLRDWPSTPVNFTSNLAQVLDSAIEQTGMHVLFLPFDSDDVRIHDTVRKQMAHSAQTTSLSRRPGEKDLLALIAHSSCALAMRLHCSVLHHVMGKPAIGLSYNDKVEAYYGVVGQSDVLFQLAFDPTQLEAALVLACTDRTEKSRVICENVSRLSRTVDEGYELLYDVIDAAGRRVPDESMVLHPRNLDRHELRAMDAERKLELAEHAKDDLANLLAQRDAEIRALRASKSYRIGNSLMKPLAALRSALRPRS